VHRKQVLSWHCPIIPILRKMEERDSWGQLGCIVRYCLKKRNNKENPNKQKKWKQLLGNRS
jgi:ABC-type uncharacterized transport system substrate-binding protein